MTSITITDGVKQTVITCVATIHSAIALLDLVSGKPAQVDVEEVLAMAERIECWAWRGLTSDPAAVQAPDPQDEALASTPPTASPPPPSQTTGGPAKTGAVSPKQMAAIFAIGKEKGHSVQEIKAWVQRRLQKNLDHLTSREASTLIDDLKAL